MAKKSTKKTEANKVKFKGIKTLKGKHGIHKIRVKKNGELYKGDVSDANRKERTAAKKAGTEIATTFGVNKAGTGTNQTTSNINSDKAKSLRGKVVC